MKIRFYVQTVTESQPELVGPFETQEARDEQARIIFNGDDFTQGEDSIFWLDVNKGGQLNVGIYTDDDLLPPEVVRAKVREAELQLALNFAQDPEVHWTTTLKDLRVRVENLPVWEGSQSDLIQWKHPKLVGNTGAASRKFVLESIDHAIKYHGKDMTVRGFINGETL